MASRRVGYRRGKGLASPHQRYGSNENWITSPIIDHDIESSEAPSSLSTPEASSVLHLEQKLPQNRRNSRSRLRNRGGKYHFVKKSEREVEDSGGVSTKSLEFDSNCSDMNGKENFCPDSSVLNLDSSNGATEVDKTDTEKGVNILEQMNSSKTVYDDVIGKRFEEFSLNVKEEPELSEEMLSINGQLQEDELLALESIYGDTVFILDNRCGLKYFQVHIHIEVPKGLQISTNFSLPNLQEKRDNDSSNLLYSFQVEYLPPIILTCLLPKSYPSKSSPLFTISVQWLRTAKISELCKMLDSIWQEQAGQEVIYQWVEWLRNCTLSCLGLVDQIVLGPYAVRDGKDQRAISGSLSPDVDILSLKRYNDEQQLENFSNTMQECCICFSMFAGSEFIRLPCHHFFCEKCMKTFSDLHVSEGTVLKLKCPEAKCEGVIPPGLLKRLLGGVEFERWESLMLQKTLESMTDVVYCPRCETACLEDEDNHAQCSKCFYSFCTLCWERRHVGVSCMTPEQKLVVLQERQKSGLMKNDQRRREQDMINQILSMKEINRIAKQCPVCNMAISRTEGCNKMVCDNCGQYFCYRCNRSITGYEHFRDGECELFPTEEIQRWEERMNNHQLAGQVQPGIFAIHVQPCPNCRQHNVKVGNNNHIFCWSCQNHYCYLCKKMVKRSAQHYGPKGCKQHTVD